MAITLTHAASSTSVTLPDALNWTDEFTWDPVEQNVAYTTTGAMVVEEGRKQSGRPYELRGSEDTTWCNRELVKQLHALVSLPGVELVLTIRGTPRTVTFDRKRGALESFPVLFYEDGSVADSDLCVPTLRFLEL